MNTNDYLQKILESQTLAQDSQEMKDLQERRDEVEKLLREHFSESSPTIRYGGSKAKGTMIREAYDLDVISYFPNDDTTAGETLKDIYNNVRKALAKKYMVETKPSALRIKNNDPKKLGVDFHIDVVPGRYTDASKKDVFLYRAFGEKERLKTNLDVHIKHVKDSGVTDAIRLLKLWRIRNGLQIKHFALELLVIKLLKEKHSSSLSNQLQHVWEQLRDNIDNLSIEDPANPTGNDLSELLNEKIRSELSSIAKATLKTIKDIGWETVFGPVEEETAEQKENMLKKAAAAVITPTKPWAQRHEESVAQG
jgi:hypothetical protein